MLVVLGECRGSTEGWIRSVLLSAFVVEVGGEVTRMLQVEVIFTYDVVRSEVDVQGNTLNAGQLTNENVRTT